MADIIALRPGKNIKKLKWLYLQIDKWVFTYFCYYKCEPEFSRYLFNIFQVHDLSIWQTDHNFERNRLIQ